MGEGFIESLGEGVVVVAETGQAALHDLGDPRPNFVSGGGRRRRAGRGGQHFRQSKTQRIQPLPVPRHNGHDRTAELDGELVHVEGKAATPRQIDHVDRHHHGQVVTLQLGNEIEVTAEIARVHHDHHGVRRRGSRFAVQGAAADLGLGKIEPEAVGAR